jgi:PIN domain nuclease of toxin-antitoxin system
MRILLDTHILLWAVGSSPRLDPETRTLIEDEANHVFFSTASIWEIAVKKALGRPDFTWHPLTILEAALAVGLVELPISGAAACHVADLPLLHRDPFDRLLIAQAIVEPAILYTADDRLVPYSELVRCVGA